IELDSGLLIQGLKDALSGSKTLLTEEEVRATLAAMQNEQREKQILAAKELAEKNKKEGEAFLAENKKKEGVVRPAERVTVQDRQRDRKSTRLNSSHLVISYAVFCLKKKKNKRRKRSYARPYE